MVKRALSQRERWCNLLAKLVAPAFAEGTAATLREYIPFFEEFGDDAFVTRSAEYVAMGERKMSVPNLSEIKALLATWLQSVGRPRHQIPLENATTGLKPADQWWVDHWHHLVATGFAEVKHCPKYADVWPDEPIGHKKAHTISMMKRFAPDAWPFIAPKEPEYDLAG